MVRCVNKYARATCEKNMHESHAERIQSNLTTTEEEAKKTKFFSFSVRFFVISFFSSSLLRVYGFFDRFVSSQFHGFRGFCFVCSSSAIPSNIFDHLQIANVYSLAFFRIEREREKNESVYVFHIFAQASE